MTSLQPRRGGLALMALALVVAISAPVSEYKPAVRPTAPAGDEGGGAGMAMQVEASGRFRDSPRCDGQVCPAPDGSYRIVILPRPTDAPSFGISFW